MLKCTHCNKFDHIKSHCFELIGYPKLWDHNHEQRKKDSKKASIVTIAEIKIEDTVAKKASALVSTLDYGSNVLNTFTFFLNSIWIIDSSATYII